MVKNGKNNTIKTHTVVPPLGGLYTLYNPSFNFYYYLYLSIYFH